MFFESFLKIFESFLSKGVPFFGWPFAGLETSNLFGCLCLILPFFGLAVGWSAYRLAMPQDFFLWRLALSDFLSGRTL